MTILDKNMNQKIWIKIYPEIKKSVSDYINNKTWTFLHPDIDNQISDKTGIPIEDNLKNEKL